MADYIVRGLHHIGILANQEDLQKCVDFYIENLGFRMMYKQALANYDCWFIECGGLVLEFVGKGAVKGIGPVYHVALEVCGIENLTEELKEKGLIASDAEINQNPNFFPSGIKNIFLEGPVGESIELFEMVR